MKDTREVKFDLRTKLMLLLVVNLFLLLSHALIFELVLVFGCLLLITIDGQPKSALHFLIAFFIMFGIDQLATPHMNGFAFTLISFLVVSLRKFLPCFILGKWILAKTEVTWVLSFRTLSGRFPWRKAFFTPFSSAAVPNADCPAKIACEESFGLCGIPALQCGTEGIKRLNLIFGGSGVSAFDKAAHGIVAARV